MKVGHIYIYGEIIPWQDDNAGAYGGVNMKDVTAQINANKDADSLVLHINSPGGDVYEGLGILDVLNGSEKKIDVVIEGLCASIATAISTIGDTVKITENSTFMIHNPWTFTGGTAEDLEKNSKELRRIEAVLTKIYKDKTGLDEAEIISAMKNETFMSASEAKEKGYVDEVVTNIKAVAKLNINNKNKMENNEIKQELTGIKAMFADFLGKFKSPKALIVQDVNGNEIDMPEIETVEQIAIGVTATVDGSPAEGNYEVEGVGTISFENGEITAIEEGEPEDVETLKQENADLKQQLSELSAKVDKQNNEILAAKALKVEATKIKAKLEALEGKFSDDTISPQNRAGEVGDNKVRTGYKSK